MGTLLTDRFRRITLLLGNATCSSHRWDVSEACPSRLIFVGNLPLLLQALHGGFSDLRQDVERVVLDGCATPDEFLDLLAHLPRDFMGDAVFIAEDGSGFINAIGRKGDRGLVAFQPADLDFYLDTHGLVEGLIDAASGICSIPEPAGELAIVAAG